MNAHAHHLFLWCGWLKNEGPLAVTNSCSTCLSSKSWGAWLSTLGVHVQWGLQYLVCQSYSQSISQCVSTTGLALQAMRRPVWVTHTALKTKNFFPDATAFKRNGVNKVKSYNTHNQHWLTLTRFSQCWRQVTNPALFVCAFVLCR
jgi:hypothetical protein